jgi:hypothetical protein
VYRRKYNIPHEWGTAVNGPHAENIRCQVAESFLAAERLDGKSAYVGCRSLPEQRDRGSARENT